MPLQIDSFNKIIQITSPTTEVDAQTLHDFTQDYLASPRGLVEDGTWDQKGEILKPEGKIEDPSNPGIFSQIILILNPEWQIQFYGGSGYTRIFGGKIVGGVSDQPLKATGTAGDISVLESPVDGVTVAAQSSDVNVISIVGSADAATRLEKGVSGNVYATVAGVPTTTSIPTSGCSPAHSGSVADQFATKVITFNEDTTTVALRGQVRDVSASSAAANPTLTITPALTATPVVGDTFTLT